MGDIFNEPDKLEFRLAIRLIRSLIVIENYLFKMPYLYIRPWTLLHLQ